MTAVELEPTRPKCLVPYTRALEHSAILSLCCVVNSTDDGKRYHLQVFETKGIILCIEMSKND